MIFILLIYVTYYFISYKKIKRSSCFFSLKKESADLTEISKFYEIILIFDYFNQ
jgi:hypothetical protein